MTAAARYPRDDVAGLDAGDGRRRLPGMPEEMSGWLAARRFVGETIDACGLGKARDGKFAEVGPVA